MELSRKRWAGVLLSVAAIAGAALAASTISTHWWSTSTTSRPTHVVDQFVPLHNAHVHVNCVGAGDRTVVLIAGFNDGGADWGTITPSLSQSSRVCSYSRFGTGRSDPPPSTQTFRSQSADLHSLLQSIGEVGPYVVVGHSIGGAQAVMFASMFPAEVIGLVLIDATPLPWRDAICAVVDNGSEAARIAREICEDISDPDSNRERLDVVAAFAEVAEVDGLGDLPMVVITADFHPFPDLDPADETRFNEMWSAGQTYWTSLSSAAQLVSVESGHYVHRDHPDVVIEHIERVSTM